jgi:prohibitin 2
MQNLSGPAAKLATAIATATIGASAIAYTAYNSLYTVEGGHRAVLFNRFTGVNKQVKGEGVNFAMPWLEWPTIYDIRTKPKKISSPTGTRDMQTVNITLRVLYKPRAESLPEVHQRFGVEYDERVLPSIANETLKSIVAQYNAAQLINQREDVSRKIRQSLEERARDFHILIEDVSITHLSFSDEYVAAVERKQVAQQQAERAKFLVLQAEQDKKSNIIRAQGEAKSAEMIGQALKKSPGFVELRKLEAARQIADTISHSQNRVFLNADSLLLNLLAVPNSAAAKKQQ